MLHRRCYETKNKEYETNILLLALFFPKGFIIL